MDECFSSDNDVTSGNFGESTSCSGTDTLVHSGQSDRLSYREAIEKHMSSPSNELPF
ncbi:unnamed protein product [Soboliphyme baturini]|uniref:Phox (PX) domain-containing protein n=1 Tax=Soboliphyme baturini TaxID=241478 RepID=A0A183I9N6_9BILA|nr:unnamed protein product [Soboliphyme baturini]